MGGLQASFMIYAEMYGQAAAAVVVITNEHSVTKEILEAFTPLVNGPMNLSLDLSLIARNPQFKPVLKELNAKSNGIFN
jgi:xanthine/uracil permease